MTSPSAILLAGGGLAVSIVAGLPLLAAAGVGAVAWGARVALAVPRAPRREHIDPFALSEPWRGFVRGALQAQARFDRTVHAAKAGPLRDRLAEIGERVKTGVSESWQVANRAQEISTALEQLDTRRAGRSSPRSNRTRHALRTAAAAPRSRSARRSRRRSAWTPS